MDISKLGVDDYEIKRWIITLGSMPIERVAHADFSEPYEMNMAHVFKLENGQYALVTECGCSCYDPSDAEIDLFPNKNTALLKFKEWEKQNK